MQVAVRAACVLVAVAMVVTAVPARAAPLPPQSFGSAVQLGDADAETILYGSGPASVCFRDANGSGVWDPAETVYLAQDCSMVQTLDVRIGGPVVLGSQVTPSQTDVGALLVAMPGSSTYADMDGDGVWSPGDVWVWDVDDSGVASSVDLVLSGANAGHAASSLSGIVLTSLPWAPAFVDPFGSQLYQRNSLVVADLNLDSLLDVQDVRMSAGSFGTVVAASDVGAWRALTLGGPTAFCFIDDDGSGTYEPGEPVYFATDCSSIGVGAIRISSPVSGSVGSQVRGSDADFGDAAVVMPGAVAYVDVDSNGHFGPGDMAVLDNQQDAVLTRGDLILSGSAFGVSVGSGTPGLFGPLVAMPWSAATRDADGDGMYGIGDVAYLDTNADGMLTVGDLQMSGHGAGAIAGPLEAVHALVPAPLAVWCFLDDNGDAVYGPEEPAFLAMACGVVQAGDVRIANPVVGALGSVVRATNPDAGKTTTAFPGTPAFDDLNGDAVYERGEPVYLDSDATLTVSPGDVALSGANAGQAVRTSSMRLNDALVALSGPPSSFDADGSGGYNVGDLVYLDVDANAHVTPGDIRIGLGSGFSGGTVPPSCAPDTGAPSPSTTSPASASSSTQTVTPTSTSGGGGGGAPPPSSSSSAPKTTSTSAKPPSSSQRPTSTTAHPGKPGPELIASLGALDTVSLANGQTRTVPITVAARTAAASNVRLVVDNADGLDVRPDSLVLKSLGPGTEQTFYLTIKASCVSGDRAGFVVVVHAEGTGVVSPPETVQVVVHAPLAHGAAALGTALGVLLLVCSAVVLRRRL